jgi:hypothetical protein
MSRQQCVIKLFISYNFNLIQQRGLRGTERVTNMRASRNTYKIYFETPRTQDPI